MPVRTPSALLALLLAAAPAAAQRPIAAPAASPDAYVMPAVAPASPIAAAEFAQRRRELAQAMTEDGVLVVLGSSEPEQDYLPFAQNSPFRYLTGLREPGAVLVMEKDGGTVTEHLFVLPRNPEREIWEGARLGAERAQAVTGIMAHTTEELDGMLARLLGDARTLYTLTPLSEDGSTLEFLRPDQQLVNALRERFPSIRAVRDLSGALLRIRAAKSPAELDMLRRAIHITTLAHRQAMRAVEPGMNEFEIHALIEGTFRRHGAERPAFSTIVGSGPNSTTLHYRAADRYMQAGETLVMDIGASYNGYAADVTRTVPVGGRFTPEQREVYEIVLAAQKAAEQQARVGVPFSQLQRTATEVIGEGLTRLGLIESPTATYDCTPTRQCQQTFLYYMHGLGHGIGLDVHDPDGGYTQYGGAFRVGSAFTIEPGIYVRADVLDYLPDTPRNRAMIARIRPAVQTYRDIGVRIEDDYFITEAGLERVSSGAPREIDEIEALMALPSAWNQERRPEVVEWYRGVFPR